MQDTTQGPLRKIWGMIVPAPRHTATENIVDSLEFPVTVLDRQGKITCVNKCWEQPLWRTGVLGDASIEVGADYLEICRQASLAGFFDADVLKGIRGVCNGSSPTYRLDYSTPDGKRWFAMTVTPILGSRGGAVVTHLDISDRKGAQSVQKESEEKFLLIAGNAPVMIWMAGPDKRCVYLNSRWLDFTGRSLDQELGDGWLGGIHPDQQSSFRAAFDDAFDKRQGFQLEYRLRCATGEFRWVMNTGVPIFKGTSQFAGFIGSCIDITDRRATEEILVDLSGRLINAQEEERSRVARELHDNLSQNMALLSIEIEQLAQHPSQSAAEITAGLRKVLNRAQEVSSEMHRMSYELHPSKLDRLGLAAATLSLCEEISSQQSLHLDYDFRNIPESLPRDVALCLYRVVQESLQNIIKHSGACNARVELLGSSSEIRLRVTDQGVGFMPETVSRAHGLGLLSMRERLRLVGGTMSIVSQPLRGTRIDVCVPLKAAAESAKG